MAYRLYRARSNMGDKEKYLNEAVEKLQQTSDCQVLKVSDFLVTAPYGGVEQDDFLNGALTLKTLLTPQELLERLHEIEQEAHRERQSTGDRGRWIWISYCMTIWYWTPRI